LFGVVVGMVILYHPIGQKSTPFDKYFPHWVIFRTLNKIEVLLLCNLYTPNELSKKIKAYAVIKGVPTGAMLKDCGFGPSTLSHLNHGKSISYDRLARIADYLDCSVDYLLGRTDKPEINK
jgi:DNA-binding Xre family transcriptional regulator